MTIKILLDYEGDAIAPQDIQVIESEVDFLRAATSGQSLLIRGAQLCAWAESFYALRGQPVQIVESPLSALRSAFPNLSPAQARELAKKIGKEYLSPQEVSSVFVLNACFPDDYTLWQGTPSFQHAARWLLWLLEHTPSEAEAVILERFAFEVETKCYKSPIREIYRAINATEAKKLLFRWLGAEKNASHTWDEFPIDLPSQWLNAVKEGWMKHIIDTNGNFFTEMLSFPLPLNLRRELASQTTEYYKRNVDQLTRTILQQLQPYLGPSSLSILEQYLPPNQPGPLPKDEDDVIEWFKNQYFPYRQWQARFGDKNARRIAIAHAQTFARWLLERYPQWLLGGEHLSFQKSTRLQDPNALTICIVLDGLPFWDAEWLAQELSARAPRLTLLQKTYSFTALPTVTEFAKDALLKGIPPRLREQTQPLGTILPDNVVLKKHLTEARKGEIYFWRVDQPDKTYHFGNEDKREGQVRAQLQSIMEEIKKVVEAIPENVQLNILLTSDHGRLMNPRSPRQLPIERGIETHGRAAWGNFDRKFPGSGFILNENEGWVELFGERFGTEYDLRIAWGEESFSLKNGTEAYPHGGLFPEEVIVPWFIFQRDVTPPKLEISLTGSGEADMNGNISVNISNNSPLELECLSIEFSYGVKLSGSWKIPPLRNYKFSASLTPWPPKSVEGNITATLLFRQANGVTFKRIISTSLQINVLYDQRDDFLKELNL